MLKTAAPDNNKDTLLEKSMIPIIDVSFGTEEIPQKSVVNRIATQITKAFREKGMALLVNHGITEEKLKIAYNYFDEFCKLPEDTKNIYLRKSETGNGGYVKPNQESFEKGKKEIRHAFNICTLDAKLPDDPLPGFKKHISELAKDFKNITSLLLQALAIGLELPANFFVEKHSHMLDCDNETTFRLLYYPPLVIDDDKNENFTKGSSTYCHQKTKFDESKLGSLDMKDKENDQEETHIKKEEVQNFTRCGAHCDYGTFTLLIQDVEGGLEVKLPNSEKWQRVGHLGGAIFANVGELLSIWTNGAYPALNHRVVIPENSIATTKGRHAIAYFVHPDNLTPIVPMDVSPPSSSQEAINEKKEKTRKKSFKAAKMKIYNAYQHVQRRFKETYAS
ncbi:hypothetical protein PVAND_009378 [Polypedilum vanderplanki]|uniref:Fe2OG dioxygenase domain-containing protein n=1 Tax=Polypedilum vanderplanki TaxID=319348 RepID=A0A9J6CCE9_POLVA|nr:hypothetical protein PVAND_009378 [Polypedilum vanderplanki]